MSNWMNIRVKTEASNFNYVRSKIEGWPSEVVEEFYWPALEAIAREGRDIIREIIEGAETPTGRERAARGEGEAGRIKSGKMYNSVTTRVRRRVKNGFSVFTGWINGKPGYSIFQEQGTRNGIEAMNAIGITEVWMLEQIKSLASGKYRGSYQNWDGD